MMIERDACSFFDQVMGRSQSSWKSAYYWASEIIRVWVYSDIPGTASSLAEYLRPMYRSGGPLYRIVVVEDANLFRAFRSASGGRIVKAKHDVFYRHVDLGRLELFIHERPLKPEHVILRMGTQLLVVLASTDEEALRVPVRIVRELLLRSLQGDGWLFMHAAAVVSSAGKAALILGDKGAGKSNLTWALVRNGPLFYVANDRCLVRKQGEVLRVHTWPLSIRLGRGLVESSAARFPKLPLRRGENALLRAVREHPPLWAEKTKVELTPKELEIATEKQVEPGGELCMLLLPSMSVGLDEPVVQVADCKAAESCFRTGVTEPEDKDYLRGWLRTRSLKDDDVAMHIAQAVAIAARLPTFSVQGGAERILATPDLFETLIEGLQ